MKKLLLQTAIPYTKDDWSIERFSMLAQYLSELTDANGNHLYAVSARDRENMANGDDKILSTLDRSVALTLSADQIKRLDDDSRIEPGFPYNLYEKEFPRIIAYGGLRDRILA